MATKQKKAVGRPTKLDKIEPLSIGLRRSKIDLLGGRKEAVRKIKLLLDEHVFLKD
jgi:hypothetical protein